SGVTSETVCRLSGKLATDGCRNAYVENPDGSTTYKSTVYTEYFARGTTQTTYCDLHSLPTRYATTTAGYEYRPAVAPHVEAVGVQVVPPAPVHPTAAPAPAPTVESVPPAPQTKKRGFWGRLFGRGEPEKSENPKENPKKPRD